MNPEQPNRPAPQPNQNPNGNGPQPQSGYSSQPVAYDQNGNPLYAQPQFVHVSRAVQPLQEVIPPEIVARHNESLKRYPHLNLSKGEYILSAVKRHPIGLFKIWGLGLVLIAAFMAVYLFVFSGPSASTDLQELNGIATAVLAVMVILVSLGTLAATYVYNANRFYLTNESVVQEIQTTLFAKHEQTVSLSNIEDASFKQGGIFPVLFNYGQIRLSTEGDETTYRFNYVANPKKEIAVLNNAVESFKNGRAIDPPNQDQPS